MRSLHGLHFGSRLTSGSDAATRRHGVRVALVLAGSLIVIGAICGTALGLSLPSQDTRETTAPVRTSVALTAGPSATTAAQTTATTAAPVAPAIAADDTNSGSASDPETDLRPDPERVSTAHAQSLGALAEASLKTSGLRLAEAVEFIPLDATDPVTQITLTSTSANSKAQVLIWIFKTPRQSSNGKAASSPDANDPSAYQKWAKATGYSSEQTGISGALNARRVTGPFGSYSQLVAELPNGMTINIISESGAVTNGTLPLDSTGVEKLLSLLIEEL